MFTSSALDVAPLSNQLNTSRINSTPQSTANCFNEVLSTTVAKGDVVSRLRSFGLPIRVKDMPRYVSCFSELSHGLTIAPNILNRMAQDEAYLQEVEQQIHYWFNVHGPSREREAARLGDNFTVFLEFTIKPNGEIIKSSGIIYNGQVEDVVSEVVNQLESVNNEASINNYSAAVDASVFLSQVGNLLHTQRRKE